MRALNVPLRRINEIVLEKRGITADTALRLARYFGTSAKMWTGLQADYDLRLVRYAYDDAFIVTAYLTDKPKTGEDLWPTK